MMKEFIEKIKGSVIWNFLFFIFSGICIAILSLLLSIGNGQRTMLVDYFRFPLTFFLNFLPVLLLHLFFVGLTGRQNISFLLTGLIVFLLSAGNYYKLIIRYEPFLASDIPYIGAGLGVAGDYHLKMNSRIILFIGIIIIGFVFLSFFTKKIGKKARIISVLAVSILLYPLYHVYISDQVYNSSYIVQRDYDREMYKTASKGFLYPFIHSLKDVFLPPPSGYEESTVVEYLASYEDTPIPSEKKINIIAIQLEAFSDIRTLGIDGISDEAYTIYDSLKKESYYGKMIVNVNGGSTIDTEQCFLTGDYAYYKIKRDTQTFVSFLKNNGYTTVGGHPYYSFYGRENTNPLIGFEDYRFCENYEGYSGIDDLYPNKNYSDVFFFRSILDQYRELTENHKDVFSFNVTMQGHGPYEVSEYWFGDSWFVNKDASITSSCILNNYLGSLANTQEYLSDFIEGLRYDEVPVIVILYGDHKPWLGDDSSVIKDLNINYDITTEEGLLNYYSTEYVIWGNDAAKNIYGDAFIGEGSMISTCYLMPVVFEKLGWDNYGYSNYLLDRMEKISVISSNGFYYDNGIFTRDIPQNDSEVLQLAEWIQYYHQKSAG